jgi:uncharacterized membrane protein YeaQ/YmgE (transglycosylase-associated protein family)
MCTLSVLVCTPSTMQDRYPLGVLPSHIIHGVVGEFVCLFVLSLFDVGGGESVSQALAH